MDARRSVSSNWLKDVSRTPRQHSAPLSARLRINPPATWPWHLWRAGRPGDAEASFKTALSLAPNETQAHRALAAFYLGSGKPLSAEPHMKLLAEADTVQGRPMKLGVGVRPWAGLDTGRPRVPPRE